LRELRGASASDIMGNVLGCKKDALDQVVDCQMPHVSEHDAKSSSSNVTGHTNHQWLPAVPAGPTPVKRRGKMLTRIGRHWNTTAVLARSMNKWKVMLFFQQTPPKQIKQAPKRITIDVVFEDRKNAWGIGLIIPANTLAAQTGAVVAVLEDNLVRTSFDSYRAANTAEAVGVKIGDMLIEVNGENVENMPHLDIVHKLKTATLPCTLAFHGMRGKQEDQKEEKVTGKSMGDSEDVEMVISTTQNTTSLEQSACSTSSSNPFAPTGVSCTRNTNPFGDDGGSTAATFATMSVTIHPDNATTPTTVDSISPQCSPTNIPDQPLHMSVQRINSVAVSIAQKKAEANIISEEELALLAAADERKRKVEEEEIQQMICTGQLMKNLDKPGEYINVLTGATVRPFQP